MTRKITITIPSVTSTYPIVMKEGILYSEELLDYLLFLKVTNFVVITDNDVAVLYAMEWVEYLKSHGLEVAVIGMPTGEKVKTRANKEYCEDYLLKMGVGRDTCIIGMGGGVVTDLAGFIAATYCRGVTAVMIPTTLVAMVDASIGGKTGVNVPQGKNMIGTITQPSAVFIDVATLKTLPIEEIKNGAAEMIKHGVIADSRYFDFMKKNSLKILQGDVGLMEDIIEGSIRIKKEIVEQYHTEKGMRRLLNFGHTIGHAIEAATNYTLSHGRAVAIGMSAEACLSMKLGYLPSASFLSISEMIDYWHFDTTWNGSSLNPSQLLDLMRLDKKAHNQTPRFVLLKEIGVPLTFDGHYCSTVDESVLYQTLEWICSDVMCSD